MIKKKETIEQNIQDFKNPVLGFLMTFYLLGTRKASQHLPVLLQSTRRRCGEELSGSFLFHLKVGIMQGILLLCFTWGSEINLLSYQERAMLLAVEKPNQLLLILKCYWQESLYYHCEKGKLMGLMQKDRSKIFMKT